jgi:chemotaxis protein MotA
MKRALVDAAVDIAAAVTTIRCASSARSDRLEQYLAPPGTARAGAAAAVREPTRFCYKGLQLVVDGSEPDVIRSTLEFDMHAREAADIRAAKVFEGMGIYSPTLGIIGAVLGLMAVMQNLDDPSKLGHGIAAAFTATVYGIGHGEPVFCRWPTSSRSPCSGAQSSVRDAGGGPDRDRTGREPAQSSTASLRGYLH